MIFITYDEPWYPPKSGPYSQKWRQELYSHVYIDEYNDMILCRSI